MNVERCKCRGECTGFPGTVGLCMTAAMEGVLPATDGYCPECRWRLQRLAEAEQ